MAADEGPEKDCEWRTGLETCFYGRLREASELGDGVSSAYTTLVLVGARNVGKSELARYTVVRVLGAKPVLVDAREAWRGVIGAPRDIVAEAARLLAEKAGLGRLLSLAERVYEVLGRDKILVVDEFHLASRDPVKELEALAKLVGFYPEYRGWRLVVTTSEGWIMASGLEARLLGYRAHIHLVEPLREQDMEALYREYSEKRGCRVRWEVYWGLVGGLPGYLPELCPMSSERLAEWVSMLVGHVRRVLAELGSSAVEQAYRLLVEGVEAETPDLIRVARRLTEHNIAYPSYPSQLSYKPQLNAYRHIIALWAERGRPPEPAQVLEAAEKGAWRVG